MTACDRPPPDQAADFFVRSLPALNFIDETIFHWERDWSFIRDGDMFQLEASA